MHTSLEKAASRRDATATPVLELRKVSTGYGSREILRGVDLYVMKGEALAIVGHNGAGKSTVLKAAFGIVPLWRGSVIVDGQLSTSISPRASLAKGLVYVPQGHRIFASLTVREHLHLVVDTLNAGRTKEQVLKVDAAEAIETVRRELPEIMLRLDKRAGTLSGGEQQMVALAMALVRKPRCLLLDEPSLGLAPKVARRVLDMVFGWAEQGDLAVIIVEQKVREVLRVAHRVVVFRNGEMSYTGPTSNLRNDGDLLRRVYL